ncbi:hypothetical protein BESB_021900 [Besnoitia besnoiti]|uniref:Uncharacterized protein n=1 Tax=Besnoitia besnoiti TaxID=94643 RepID=A0A2A9M2T4_BESBE|nr:hypothetical protein BESB_021900 [Besnoitia besnoiti]PFH32249.1 hypothetical protein BESB_021900 [Besnoitia besnoiti]
MGQKKAFLSGVDTPLEGGSRPCVVTIGKFVTIWRQRAERGGALRPLSACVRPSPDGHFLACCTGGTSLCVLDAVGVTDPARRLPFAGDGASVVSVLLPHDHPPPAQPPLFSPSAALSPSSRAELRASPQHPSNEPVPGRGFVSAEAARHDAPTNEVFRMLRLASDDPENRRFRCFTWSPPLLRRFDLRAGRVVSLDLGASLLCAATRDGSVALWGVPCRRRPLQQRLSLLCDLSRVWEAAFSSGGGGTRAAERRGSAGGRAAGTRTEARRGDEASPPLCHWWVSCNSVSDGHQGCREAKAASERSARRATPNRESRSLPAGETDSRPEADPVPTPLPSLTSVAGETAAGVQSEGSARRRSRGARFKEGGVVGLAACSGDECIRSLRDPLVAFTPNAASLLFLRRPSEVTARATASGNAERVEPTASQGLSRASCGSQDPACGAGPAAPSGRRSAEGLVVSRRLESAFSEEDDAQQDVATARVCLCAVAGAHAISIFWVSNTSSVRRRSSYQDTDADREPAADSSGRAGSGRRAGLQMEVPSKRRRTSLDEPTAPALAADRTLRAAETGDVCVQPAVEAAVNSCAEGAGRVHGEGEAPTSSSRGARRGRKPPRPFGRGGSAEGAAVPRGGRMSQASDTLEEGEGADRQEAPGTASTPGGGELKAGDCTASTGKGRKLEFSSRAKRTSRVSGQGDEEEGPRSDADAPVLPPALRPNGRPVRTCRSRNPVRIIDESTDEEMGGTSADDEGEAKGNQKKETARARPSEGIQKAKAKGSCSKGPGKGVEEKSGRKRKWKPASSDEDDDLYQADSSQESSSDDDDLVDEDESDSGSAEEEDSEEETGGERKRKKSSGRAQQKKRTANAGPKGRQKANGGTGETRLAATPHARKPRPSRMLVLPSQHDELHRALSAGCGASSKSGTAPGRGEGDAISAPGLSVTLLQVLLLPGSSTEAEGFSTGFWRPSRREKISDIALTPLAVEQVTPQTREKPGERSRDLRERKEAAGEADKRGEPERAERALQFQVLVTTCNGSLLAFPCRYLVRWRESAEDGSRAGLPHLEVLRCDAATPQLLLPGVGLPATDLTVQAFLPFFGLQPPPGAEASAPASGARTPGAHVLEPSGGAAEAERRPDQDAVRQKKSLSDTNSQATSWLWAVCACGELLRAVVFDGCCWTSAPLDGSPAEAGPWRGAAESAPAVASFAALVPLDHVPPGAWDAFAPFLPPLAGRAESLQRAREDAWLPQAALLAVDPFGALVPYVLSSSADLRSLPSAQPQPPNSSSLCEERRWTLRRLGHSAACGSACDAAEEGSLMRPLACGTRLGGCCQNLVAWHNRPTHSNGVRCGAERSSAASNADVRSMARSSDQCSAVTAVYVAAARGAGFRVFGADGTSDSEEARRQTGGVGGSMQDKQRRLHKMSSLACSDANGKSCAEGSRTSLPDEPTSLGVLLSELRGRSAHQLQVMQQLGKLRPRSMQQRHNQQQTRGGRPTRGGSTLLGLASSSSGTLLFSLTLHQQVYVHLAVAPVAASVVELLLLAWHRRSRQVLAAMRDLVSQARPERPRGSPASGGEYPHGGEQGSGAEAARGPLQTEEAQKRGGDRQEESGCDGRDKGCSVVPLAPAPSSPHVVPTLRLPLALARTALEAADATSLWDIGLFLWGAIRPASSASHSPSRAARAAGTHENGPRRRSARSSSALSWDEAELEEGGLSGDSLEDHGSGFVVSDDDKCAGRSDASASCRPGAGALAESRHGGLEENDEPQIGERERANGLHPPTKLPGEPKECWSRSKMQLLIAQRDSLLRVWEDGLRSFEVPVKPEDVPSLANDLMGVSLLRALSEGNCFGSRFFAHADVDRGSSGECSGQRRLVSEQRGNAERKPARTDDGGDRGLSGSGTTAYSLAELQGSLRESAETPQADLRRQLLLGLLLFSLDAASGRFGFQQRLSTEIGRTGCEALASGSLEASRVSGPLCCLLLHLRQGVDWAPICDSSVLACFSQDQGSVNKGTCQRRPCDRRSAEVGPQGLGSWETAGSSDWVHADANGAGETQQQHKRYIAQGNCFGMLWHWERVKAIAATVFLSLSSGRGEASSQPASPGDTSAASAPSHAGSLALSFEEEAGIAAAKNMICLQSLVAVLSLSQQPTVTSSPVLPRGADWSRRRREHAKHAPSRRSELAEVDYCHRVATGAGPVSETGVCISGGSPPTCSGSIGGVEGPDKTLHGPVDPWIELEAQLKSIWGLGSLLKGPTGPDVHGDEPLSSKVLARSSTRQPHPFGVVIYPGLPSVLSLPHLEQKLSSSPFLPSDDTNGVATVPRGANDGVRRFHGVGDGLAIACLSTHTSAEVAYGNSFVEGRGSVVGIYSCITCGSRAEVALSGRGNSISRRAESESPIAGEARLHDGSQVGWWSSACQLLTTPFRGISTFGGEERGNHRSICLQLGSILGGGGASLRCPLCRGDLRRAD